MKNVILLAALVTCSVPAVAQRSPEAQSGAFFDQLRSGTPEAAVANLTKPSLFTQKVAELQSVTGQLKTVAQIYGAVRGYELIKTQSLGADVIHLIYLLKYDKMATRWKFVFYRSSTNWSLIHFNFDDQANTWFEDKP